MNDLAKIYTGEYYEIDGQIYVFARVSAHAWNFISVSTGQPYSENPYENHTQKWYREFNEWVILSWFDLHTSPADQMPRSMLAKKLKKYEDFIVRVRDYSGQVD